MEQKSQHAGETTPGARLHAVVHGRVQGVSFRYYAAREAQRLRLDGWVANRPNSTVETVVEGPREALDEYVTFLHRGSPAALVQRVDVDWQAPTGEFRGFRVQYL